MDGFSSRRHFAALAVVALSLITSSSWAATINVPTDQPTIQAAINAASNGDVVVVAPGTYYEHIDFMGKAITLRSSGGAASTILDGNNSGPILQFHNAEGSSSVLQGFTLTHASITTTSGSAAVVMSYASPTIEDNVFVNNSDISNTLSGSAILGVFSSAVIVRNDFTDNVGMTSLSANQVVISLSGGSPVVADNVFLNNSAIACYLQLIGHPQVYNNTMVGNTIALEAVAGGVPAGPGTFSNNLIAFNQVGVAANTPPLFSNNLVYGNTTADYWGVASKTGINGNLSSDPLLKDWANGNVHLSYGSPAIDAGDSTVSQASSTDFYGSARVTAGVPNGSSVVDIGASEYSPPAVTAVGASLQALSGIAKAGTLAASGADSVEPLKFAVTSPPAHGTLTLMDPTTGAFQYLAASGYQGADSFTFDVADPYGTASGPATEQVTVSAVTPATSGSSATNTGTAAGSNGGGGGFSLLCGLTLLFAFIRRKRASHLV